MSWLLKLLGGALGPYLAAGVALLFLTSTLTACVQGKRAEHLKAERDDARAALTNPATKKTWRSEAQRDGAALAQCHLNASALQDGLTRQTGQIVALEAQGRAAVAEADKAVQQARTATQRAAAAAARISARPPVGGDACARLLDVDRKLTEALQ